MKKIDWNGHLQVEAVDILSREGSMIVSPSKVGYVILTSDKKGLDKLFESKKRSKNKPGVIICGSMEQLESIAKTNEEIINLIKEHWQSDTTLGCILPWKESVYNKLSPELRELMMDNRKTSCFIIRPGRACELIVKEVWEKHGKILFASSANPSGKSNKGKVELIGDDIEKLADLIICANDYVESIQKNIDSKERHEQSIMISMVDEHGNLIPLQNNSKNTIPCPTIIRKGLGIEKSMLYLSNNFNSWDYKNGSCY